MAICGSMKMPVVASVTCRSDGGTLASRNARISLRKAISAGLRDKSMGLASRALLIAEEARGSKLGRGDQLSVAAQMLARCAEQAFKGDEPLGIETDRQLAGRADRAMELDRLLMNMPRALSDLGLGTG